MTAAKYCSICKQVTEHNSVDGPPGPKLVEWVCSVCGVKRRTGK